MPLRLHASMYHPVVYASLLPLFALQVAAQSVQLTFSTPPALELATNGVTAFFAVATFMQFLLVVTYLCRGRPHHRTPGSVAALALLLLSLAYSIGSVQEFFTYSLDKSSPSDLVQNLIRGFLSGARLCQGWADAAMILTTTLIILDRYSTHNKSVPESARKWPLSFYFIIPTLYFLTLLVFIFSSASAAVLALQDVFIDGHLAPNFLGSKKVHISNSLLYTATAVYFVATLISVPFAIIVKQRTTPIKIMNWTVYAIIPLLSLKSIAQIALVIEASKLNTIPFSGGRPDFDLATIITNGTLYFFVGCVFCHLFLRPWLWRGFGEYSPSAISPMPIQQFPGRQG
ncbi:hypothetical protein BU17DRAFT_63130 [Hysterangium stoloniferum]|nr:hypothetical protein BU17DRAFT_63130 [Hysterangium stoloniferum]